MFLVSLRVVGSEISFNFGRQIVSRTPTFLSVLKWTVSLVHILGPLAFLVYAAFNALGHEQTEHLLWFVPIYLFVMLLVEIAHRRELKEVKYKLTERSRHTAKGCWKAAHGPLRELLIPNYEKVSEREEAKKQMVGWAVQMIAQRTESYWDQPRINIFVFTDENCDTLKACIRSEPTDDHDPPFKMAGSVLMWAARIGRCIVVPCMNPRWHPFDIGEESSSQSKIVKPLMRFDDKSNYCCVGLITIESPASFHFNSRRWRDVADIVELLASLVQLVLGDPPFRRKVG